MSGIHGSAIRAGDVTTKSASGNRDITAAITVDGSTIHCTFIIHIARIFNAQGRGALVADGSSSPGDAVADATVHNRDVTGTVDKNRAPQPESADRAACFLPDT